MNTKRMVSNCISESFTRGFIKYTQDQKELKQLHMNFRNTGVVRNIVSYGIMCQLPKM